MKVFRLLLTFKKEEGVGKMKKGIFWGIGMGVLILLCFGYCLYKEVDRSKRMAMAPVAETEPTVTVQKIISRPLVIQQKYIGSVIPIKYVNILPFISGFVDEVRVQGGQEVQEGDVLFVLQQDEYKAQLDSALADILKAQADFTNAQVYYERVLKTDKKALSATEIDNAKASYLSAKAAVAGALANFEVAKVSYQYTTLKAPISGVIGNVEITKGDYVSPAGSPLIKLIQYSPIRVVFSISDKEYLKEKKNQASALFQKDAVRLQLADGTTFDLPGTVQFLNNEVTASTGSVQVFADFENPAKDLLSNAYVNVIVEKQIPNGILVPQKLVTMKADGNYVNIVGEDNLIQTVKVETGPVVGANFVIESGLKEGAFLITDSISRLDVSKPVKIRLKQPPAEPAMTRVPAGGLS